MEDRVIVSQSELAKACGVSPSTIAKWEKDGRFKRLNLPGARYGLEACRMAVSAYNGESMELYVRKMNRENIQLRAKLKEYEDRFAQLKQIFDEPWVITW